MVRKKSQQGPIGICNSQLINLELETEFKKKHEHVLKLNNRNTVIDDDLQGYVDENGVYHGVDENQKLFKDNERLLLRLTNFVNKNSDVGNDITYGANDITSATENIVDITNQGVRKGTNSI